jgi:lipopolysaccharide assembly outer membrane protein LptD (OstA)
MVSGLGSLFPVSAAARDEKLVRLERYAGSFEIIRGGPKDTIYIIGAVVLSWGADTLYADSVQWIRDERITMFGNVIIRDTTRELTADKVIYDIPGRLASAFGKKVTLISARDSLMAVGTNAFYKRDSAIYNMTERSTIYLSYPDSANTIRVDADRITFDGKGKIGYADGHVVINQTETESQSEQAILYVDDNTLYLYGSPVARRHDSEIRGDSMTIISENRSLSQVRVKGNAVGNFKEPSAKDSSIYDICDLKSAEMQFNLKGKELNNILASGQAYSFYAPGAKDSAEIVRNNTSGDTIKLFLEDKRLQKVQIIGGAEGEYFNGKYKNSDSGRVFVEDTVRYRSDSIEYTMVDTTIHLVGGAAVENKTLSLTAHRIRYNTARELVTAYDDSTYVDSTFKYIPVILRDGTEEMFGSYLEYSMDTQRGMLRQSKTEYQDAYYRGKELFREKKDVYYVENGIYTSCDREEPHFHFSSKNMKMIQGDKIIARPVVFYIEKLPLMIVPYYVFPIKPGRHSGFLPFRIGNFERGAGSISNIGYYWAASQYWDLQASLNYYENYGFAYNSTFRYNIRYYLSGSVTGTYTSNTSQSYNQEIKTRRYSIQFSHSQTFSPTFSLKASGNFISDKKYYTDFSTDLDDRLNRNIRSQIAISKKWGNISLSAQFVHSVALDQETRTDEYPTASLSFPSGSLFGSGKKSDDSKETKRKWYQNIYFGYQTNLRNYSYRITDTTTGIKSRKEYITIDHSPRLTLAPISLFKYIKIGPAFNYQETWYKIMETDQSKEAGIRANDYYRRYSFGASLSLSTDLYGTVYPNIAGLIGLRHVLTPSISFSWTPEINKHNELKTYTGIGGGGSKQRVMTLSLRQIFSAKTKSGEESKSVELITFNSSTQYNFLAEKRKFSSLSTSAQTSLLGNLRMNANMTHDLYKPGTDELQWWSPHLINFNISTTYSIGGTIGGTGGYGSIGDTTLKSPLASPGGSQKWSFSFSHYYSESKLSGYFSKIHSINLNLSFDLTSNWKITYRQSYDIGRDRTVSRQVSIERNLHCWQGYFYWVPDGSNRGYYFRINIISIPDIKFEKSESGIKGMFF